MEEKAVRNSVKIVLLDSRKRLLLMSVDNKGITGKDGKYDGRFWQLIGGSIENEETMEQAIKRELFEETSIPDKDVTFGPIIWHGELDLIMHGINTHIIQSFVLAKTNIRKSVSIDNLTAQEKETVKELRWFSIDEIECSEEIIYPRVLPQHLRSIISGNIPQNPIKIDL